MTEKEFVLKCAIDMHSHNQRSNIKKECVQFAFDDAEQMLEEAKKRGLFEEEKKKKSLPDGTLLCEECYDMYLAISKKLG